MIHRYGVQASQTKSFHWHFQIHGFVLMRCTGMDLSCKSSVESSNACHKVQTAPDRDSHLALRDLPDRALSFSCLATEASNLLTSAASVFCTSSGKTPSAAKSVPYCTLASPKLSEVHRFVSLPCLKVQGTHFWAKILQILLFSKMLENLLACIKICLAKSSTWMSVLCTGHVQCSCLFPSNNTRTTKSENFTELQAVKLSVTSGTTRRHLLISSAHHLETDVSTQALRVCLVSWPASSCIHSDQKGDMVSC